MRVKRKLNLAVAEQIKGLSSVELNDKCPDLRKVFPSTPCTNLGCEYAIGQPGYMNCAFVAAEAGAHTLEAIGEMMGITREGVRLIEVRAMERFREGWQQQVESNESTLQEPDLAPRSGRVDANQGMGERAHESHNVSVGNRRELAQRPRRSARA